MAISKLHYLDVVDGEFHGTTADDLQQLFDAVEQHEFRDHLVVHFHGGLVPRTSAMQNVVKLLPDYIQSRSYPIFFVWNSGALGALAHNLDEVAQEPAFHRLVRRLAQLLAGKLAEKGGTRGPVVQVESLKSIPTEPEKLYEWTRKHESTTVKKPSTLSASQQDQIKRELMGDPVLIKESLAIAAGLRNPEEIQRDLEERSRGGFAVRASRKTLMSPVVLKKIAEKTPDKGSRGINVLGVLAEYGVKIAKAVIKRYRNGRDHGLMATIIEEVGRVLYFDSIGSVVWELMKGDTEDAFGGDPLKHAGTAFLDHLRTWWKPGRHVTLIGHSTGAVYIYYLLKYADGVLPAGLKFDIVFLAPVSTFELIHGALPLFTKRVSGFRMFALQDDLERGYWEVPFLYPASLLYMVSGLFEPEADTPLLGMQRYHQTGPYDFPEVQAVREWIADRCIWSVSQGLLPGLQSTSHKHGAFNSDRSTRESVKHILRNGF